MNNKTNETGLSMQRKLSGDSSNGGIREEIWLGHETLRDPTELNREAVRARIPSALGFYH
jgi:hypothetical protein